MCVSISDSRGTPAHGGGCLGHCPRLSVCLSCSLPLPAGRGRPQEPHLGCGKRRKPEGAVSGVSPNLAPRLQDRGVLRARTSFARGGCAGFMEAGPWEPPLLGHGSPSTPQYWLGIDCPLRPSFHPVLNHPHRGPLLSFLEAWSSWRDSGSWPPMGQLCLSCLKAHYQPQKPTTLPPSGSLSFTVYGRFFFNAQSYGSHENQMQAPVEMLWETGCFNKRGMISEVLRLDTFKVISLVSLLPAPYSSAWRLRSFLLRSLPLSLSESPSLLRGPTRPLPSPRNLGETWIKALLGVCTFQG